MANLRVFISSTYYDLKHVRSYISDFITKMGYEPTLSEKGKIAYDPATHLDESCYKDAEDTDILVLVVGGRYGSATSETDEKILDDDFYQRYVSVTRKEFETAYKNDVPTYILVEKPVMTEYETFKKNRDNESIHYAHVDSINIFHFLDDILGKGRNNALFQFEQAQEIEAWLKNQWSGYFRSLLEKKSQNQQLNSLSKQVGDLSGINNSLQRYLEKIIESVAGDSAQQIIENEHVKLSEERVNNQLLNDPTFKFYIEKHNLTLDEVKLIFSGASIEDVAKSVCDIIDSFNEKDLIQSWIENGTAIPKINEIRELLQVPEFELLSPTATTSMSG